MAATAEHDVVVIGAGPSGAAAAIRLANLGFDVALVERKPFPRGQVGICLSDATIALLDHIGVGIGFEESRFWRRRLTAVYWGDEQVRFVPQPGYHVDRGVLDQLLLERARKLGVTIYQPVIITASEQLGSGDWQIHLALAEHGLIIASSFVVDAAGRRGFVRGQRVKDGPPLLALHATWSLARAPDFDGLIEAGGSAWLWYAQTASEQAVVSVFCDPRRLASTVSPQERYLDLLHQFLVLGPGHLARCLSPLTVCDATSHHAADPIGERYVCVGDAGLAVDPLSSQGVHLALQSGLQGAVVANTILAKPSNAAAARQFYRSRSADRVRRYADQTRLEYARVAATQSQAFWTDRAAGAPNVSADNEAPALSSCGLADRVAVSAGVTIDILPVIDGDYVELRKVVRQEGVEGTIAYFDGIEIAEMLELVPTGIAFSSLPSLWGDWVTPARGMEIAQWLWKRRVLVQAH